MNDQDPQVNQWLDRMTAIGDRKMREPRDPDTQVPDDYMWLRIARQ